MRQYVYNFKKYNNNPGTGLILWSYFQLTFSACLLLFMFYNYADIAKDGNLILLNGVIIFAGIFGYTAIMDKKKYGLWVEIMRSVAGLICIYYLGNWFGIDKFIQFGSTLVIIYFCCTILGAFYFTKIQSQEAS